MNTHTEIYTINERTCSVTADFAQETVCINAQGFSHQYKMDEYTKYNGNMLAFATEKLGAASV